jgi:hypothetical protein
MDHEAVALRPLDDPIELYKVHHVLERILHSDRVGSLTIVKQDGWIAVPVESGYHFSDADQCQLLQAIVDNGDHRTFAVALEALGDFPSAYEVSLTEEGISAFNHRFGHFNFALVADEPSWVVICTTSEYFIVAGKLDFVRRALGGELEASFAHFHEFASDMNWPKNVRNYLLSILTTLQRNYLQAEPGTVVEIT